MIHKLYFDCISCGEPNEVEYDIVEKYCEDLFDCQVCHYVFSKEDTEQIMEDLEKQAEDIDIKLE